MTLSVETLFAAAAALRNRGALCHCHLFRLDGAAAPLS